MKNWNGGWRKAITTGGVMLVVVIVLIWQNSSTIQSHNEIAIQKKVTKTATPKIIRIEEIREEIKENEQAIEEINKKIVQAKIRESETEKLTKLRSEYKEKINKLEEEIESLAGIYAIIYTVALLLLLPILIFGNKVLQRDFRTVKTKAGIEYSIAKFERTKVNKTRDLFTIGYSMLLIISPFWGTPICFVVDRDLLLIIIGFMETRTGVVLFLAGIMLAFWRIKDLTKFMEEKEIKQDCINVFMEIEKSLNRDKIQQDRIEEITQVKRVLKEKELEIYLELLKIRQDLVEKQGKVIVDIAIIASASLVGLVNLAQQEIVLKIVKMSISNIVAYSFLLGAFLGYIKIAAIYDSYIFKRKQIFYKHFKNYLSMEKEEKISMWTKFQNQVKKASLIFLKLGKETIVDIKFC